MALVCLLYGDALGYAFMYDDGIDLARGEQRSVGSLLTSGEGAFYYRPVPFIIWKAMRAALGWYDPFWFHLLPLALHAINGLLVVGLARWLGFGRLSATVAGALFILLPFHYQAVPWAGAVFHPLLTTLILGALLTYARFRAGRGRWWLGVSLLCGLVALFTHESSVVLGVLVGALELRLWHDGRVGAWRPFAALYLGAAGLFALWWLAVPKWPRAFAVDPESLGRNALMYLQAILWPITIGWRWAPPPLATQPEMALAAIGVLALAIAVLLTWRTHASPLLLAGLGWAVVTALPVWATLSWEYLEDGARLYYLPGVGIALAWAALVPPLPALGRRRYVAAAALSAVYLWAAAQSVAFLDLRRAMYGEGTTLLRDVAARAVAGSSGRVVFVNLPAWKAPAEPAFPLGNTGVTFIPEYVLLGQALQVNGAAATAVESVASRELIGQWPPHFGPHGHWTDPEALAALIASADAVYLTHYEGGIPTLERLVPAAGAEPSDAN